MLELKAAAPQKPKSAGELLARAAQIYDAPNSPLRLSASSAGRHGFLSGAEWMRQVLEEIRDQPIPMDGRRHWQALGLAKYGLAGGGALLWITACIVLDLPLLALLAIIVFYAAEAQMVFLFPLAIDGSPKPFRESRRWTLRAGGTLTVIGVVLPVAVSMLFGGFLGRGFVRSWCLGCLAVCLWYVELSTCYS